MFSYRKFFIVLLVVGAVGLPTVATIDFFWKQKDKYAEELLRTFNTRQTDILYFGDSSIRFTGRQDQNKAGIDQLFQTKTGLSLCTIANPGYSAVVYSEYVRLLDKCRYKPRLAIIPINLRDFTGTATRRPAFDFPLRQIYVRYRYNGDLELASYLKYRFLGLEEQIIENWRKQQVSRNGVSIGTHNSIQEESRIPEELDYSPERENLYRHQLALKFRYHYMASVSSSDSMFSYLDKTIQHLKELKIPVLFYLTPINYSDGIKYAGKAFTGRIEMNISTIEKFMKERDVRLLNLATSLDASNFVDKQDVYEHYNYSGRDFIASRVAKTTQDFFHKVHQ